MLPIVLLLIAAQSAYGAPYSVSINQYSIDEVGPVGLPALGQVNGNLIQRAFESVDNGDNTIYVIDAILNIRDIANLPDATSQALALGQAVAVLGELSNGVPGNCCGAANVVSSYANGNSAAAVAGYKSLFAGYVNSIVGLHANPEGARFARGYAGSCAGNGRTYNLEASWDGLFDTASVSNIGAINQQYCAARRLYDAHNVRSNNVGAAITATAAPCVVEWLQSIRPQLTNFVTAVASGSNVAAAGSQLLGSL